MKKSLSARELQVAQQTVYQSLLRMVKTHPPEDVLLEFKCLFLYHGNSINTSALNALYEIIFHDNEVEFRNTIKRACYILVNNWDANRRPKAIQDLIGAFQDEYLSRSTISPTLSRLRIWILNFQQSQDYSDLKLFADRYNTVDSDEEVEDSPWVRRYTSYLLVPQYVDMGNSIEQREAARAMVQELRDKFKFDLAMYVARSQSILQNNPPLKNPTALGDDTLRLVKMIVAKRGTYSYGNLANIFLNQIQSLTYVEFKRSLQKYLVFSVGLSNFSHVLQTRMADKLSSLYEEHHHEVITSALILRTINRIVELLTMETQKEPSSLFVLLLSQGNPMTLVVTLLKLILISRNSRTHLEVRIADLVRYYQEIPEEDCKWFVNFLEIFNVTFTIYADNVHYNLIRMETDKNKCDPIVRNGIDSVNLDSYRVFSQLRPRRLVPEEVLEKPEPERLPEAPTVPVMPEATIDREAFLF